MPPTLLEIESRAQLDQTRFEQFNFIYLMPAPPWQEADFKMTDGDVMNKIVWDYSYPTEGVGRALVPELIVRAHQKNVKMLLSIPGGGKEFCAIASDSIKRTLFARVMAAFVKKDNFDGIEIDWERGLQTDQHYLGVFWWEFQGDFFPPSAEQEYATRPLVDHVFDTIRGYEQEKLTAPK